MSTAITLAGAGISDETADAFFHRIRDLEDLLSRFRPHSQLSRLARSDLDLDAVHPSVRLVVAHCEALRLLTGGDFEHEPRRRTGDPGAPLLDVNAFAKGWIIEEAAAVLRLTATDFLVNAGGDVLASGRAGLHPWRVGVQHPTERAAVLGTFTVRRGAVATSGAYEQGDHIRTRDAAAPALTSVTVVGPDLAEADGLATAVYASGHSPPPWWAEVDPAYGLLTLSAENRLRWLPPEGGDIDWEFPH